MAIENEATVSSPSFSAKHTLSTLTNAAALSEFDALVRRGLVVYSPCKIVRLQVDNFHFEFRISQSLTNKPQSGEGLKPPNENRTNHSRSSSNSNNNDKDSRNSDNNDASSKPATFGPGSDLACPTPDLIIATIHTTHILVPNGYSVFRPQFLLLTQDSYRRQHEILGREDLEAARAVLCALGQDNGRRYFAMFNCGRTAGASRQHKHMHMIPCVDDEEEIDQIIKLPTVRKGVNGDTKAPASTILPNNPAPRSSDIPFAHFRAPLSPSEFQEQAYSERVLDAYLGLLAEMRSALGDRGAGDAEGNIPHNVILVEDWIMVIPRSKDRYRPDVAVNGAGMVGSVWLDREEILSRWVEIGPAEVLRGVGYPPLT
ncbi:hypothetical protein ASPACDRAFT_60028 [Aspergillus aculeatus ATCC 16872]|uniref:Uncharacterized protein n=1 Tax=Aspergillus aculeatus (strain ATCC 16872 / CBS 172.66 / WB 5094) TaxID=690307 RepID=A0A1L9WV87_ASPA1|nr:uncharacterized protein ASPACDRAFT_60028 [Aspergillus aculeatus ATCC 16872]OJK00177.1 hypothetical protein ASPACDRAFT_60028 [Aspergillus aculeatus ATCC 16872]